jgi:hypothetical protein
MSNAELMVLTVAALGLHLVALAVAILRRRPKVIARIVLIFAAAIVFLLAFNLRWPLPPIDPQLLVLAVWELAIGAVAIIALLRGYRWAAAATWTAFGLHTLMSALAMLFALTFKINRLM